MTNPGVVIRPLTGALGAELSGIDLAGLSDTHFEQVYQAFLDYQVLVFRDQVLTEEQFAAFGKRFGELESEPFLPFKSENVEGVYYLRGAPRDAARLSTQNLGWHVDHSYLPNPTKAAMLYAVDVPDVGGDTLFASNYESYAGLSDAMQVMLADKVAVHDVLQYGLKSGHNSVTTVKSIEALAKLRAARPPVEHPLVCKHPETGQPMLFLNRAWTTAISDLHKDESDALLDMLFAHAVKDVYQCRVRWANQSLVIWDNRAVQHSPNSDYTGQRHMMRLAVHSDWIPSGR